VLTVFDIGMFDGADTKYHLQNGFRVVAVEGNPDLVASAEKTLASYVSAGQLVCVNKAISADGEPVELVLSGADLGASSTQADRIASRWPIGKLKVAGTTMRQLIEEYGVPHFIKSDIEGADRFCVLGLAASTRPQYLSALLRGDRLLQIQDHQPGVVSRAGQSEKLSRQARSRHYAPPRLR